MWLGFSPGVPPVLFCTFLESHGSVLPKPHFWFSKSPDHAPYFESKLSRIFKTRGNNEWMLYCKYLEFCYFIIMLPNLSMCQEWSLLLTSFFAVTITSRTFRMLSTCFVVLLLRSTNLDLYQESISCRISFLLIWSPGNVITFCYKVCFFNKLNSPQNINNKINP